MARLILVQVAGNCKGSSLYTDFFFTIYVPSFRGTYTNNMQKFTLSWWNIFLNVLLDVFLKEKGRDRKQLSCGDFSMVVLVPGCNRAL